MLTKSLGVAFILGLFVAGLGHIYLGYIKRGLIFLIFAIILIAQVTVDRTYSSIGLIFLFLIYAWSLADLYQLYKKDESLIIKDENACSKCGFKNNLSSEFCIKCGSKILNNCPKCGQPTNQQMTYCGKCGTPLTA